MNKKEVFAWGMYDLANTIFSALFVTFFFPFYVKEFLGSTEFQIGLVFGLSMLAVGIFVPFIGSWSDHSGKRMPFIMFFTGVCCFFTMLVAGAGLFGALLAGFIANFSFHAALTTYNALLPDVAGKSEVGRVSGVGIAMGYAGTIFSLLIAAFILSNLGWESKAGIQSMFLATSAMFLIFAMPTFMFLHEKRRGRGFGFNVNITRSARAVLSTLKDIRKHKDIFRFLASMFFFANGINAAIVFLFLFGRQQIGLSVKAFFVIYAVQSLGAVIGSILAGKAVDKWNAKNVLFVSGFGWIFVICLLLITNSLWMFIFAGTLGGAALGSVWTAQRPKLLELVHRTHVGQFFGFLELTNKFSGVFGPIIFGALATFVNYSTAIASLSLFFIIGLVLLRNVGCKICSA